MVVDSNDEFLPGLNETSAEDAEALNLRAITRNCSLAEYSGSIAAISSRWSHNYFHWLLNVFTKFEVLERAYTFPDYYFTPCDHEFQREGIAALGIGEDMLIPARSGSHVNADTVFVASVPGISGYVRRSSLDFVRRCFLIGERPTLSSKRLFISRSAAGGRRVVNEKEIAALLRDHGFETVRLEGISIREQAGLFSDAELIVAPHGAGLANLVFCEPGTAVVELFGDRYINDCYWGLSCQLGLRYFYLQGKSADSPDDDRASCLNYHVPPNDLAGTLARVLEERAWTNGSRVVRN
jgi:capsular polysaccharide biosynthesis protein